MLPLVLLVGCSRHSDTLNVTGNVKNADGSPLTFEAGSVIFQATEGSSHASGSVQPDGSFTMMTKKPGDGVKPGHYKVAIQLWKSYRDSIPAVPKKYTDPATSQLEANVDSIHTHFDFTIEKGN
jgi:hypothetical protein